MYHNMRKFTPLNAMGQANDRLRVVRAAALVFSEVQRFAPIQEEFLTNVKDGVSGTLREFSDLIHDWGVISTAAVKKDVLMKRCKVWIFKYNTTETPYLILRQEFAVAALASLAVTVAVIAAVEALAMAWDAMERVLAVAAPEDEVTEP